METNQFDRREFLRSFSMLAGASVLAANPWLQSLNAQETGSRHKVKLAVIGVGSRGKLLTQIMLTIPDIEIVAYCDNYPKNLEEAGNLIGPGARGFSDYKELLEMDEIQGVVIAVPLNEHARLSIDAMNKGKHVFCEKAMAITNEECLAMMQVHRETGKILQIGHQRLFSVRYLKGMEMIQ